MEWGKMVHAAYRLLAESWWCISISGGIGYLIGSIFTRRLMAPSFCPDCIKRKRWIEEFNQKTEGEQEKAESKRFYWLRKKRKRPPNGHADE